MIYDYIIENYEGGEPIFLNELPCTSRDYLRQEMKSLVDSGKLERMAYGVYFLPFNSVLGIPGRISIEKYIEKKYLGRGKEVRGYVSGLQLANQLGFTTQNPAVYEICSNKATTKQRKLEIDGRTIILYSPATEINFENRTALQFLDLMTTIDIYNELSDKRRNAKLKSYADSVNFELVKRYLPLYPDKVYRNIYDGGLMSELV